MTHSKESKRRFSAFRSAAEEAAAKRQTQDRDNEGGHMSSVAGRVVGTPGSSMPYKAILSFEGGKSTEHAFATMREAEAFIRRNTPLPPTRSRTYDHGEATDQNGTSAITNFVSPLPAGARAEEIQPSPEA